MITVQDRIDVVGEQVGTLLAWFRERYQPAAAQRGLHFVEAQVSPPVQLQQQPSTVCLRWQVADVAAWWAMRAQSMADGVAEFWTDVDRICSNRERIYLCPADADALPGPADVDQWKIQTRGHRETAQLALRDGLDPAAEQALADLLRQADEALPGLEACVLAKNLAPEYAAGDYTWALLFTDRATADQARDTPFWQEQVIPALTRDCRTVHAVGMETIDAGLREPQLSNGIKRTAFFRLLPGVDTATAERFEADSLEMAAQIPEILNWRLSHAQTLPWSQMDELPWTYVWEQEFADLEGLQGPYMIHPHHWAHIDRWFDPESGVQAVDTGLSHAFSPLAESLLALETVC